MPSATYDQQPAFRVLCHASKNPGVRGSAPCIAVEQSPEPTTAAATNGDVSVEILQNSPDHNLEISFDDNWGFNKKLFDLLARRRSILPQSLLGKAVRYALNQWPNLTIYLDHGRVEIDTNLVENAIRPTKLGAKNWIFIGRKTAGEKTAILYTVVENCRRLGIDPREYLEDVLTRLPSMKTGEAASLMPANWLKARQVTTRRAA